MVAQKVCAVVVTHNRRDVLVECLQALRAQRRAPEEVLVIDNASSDGTSDLVKERFPEVRLVRLEVNQHCAGGYHEGLKAARAGGADWIWLLDDDAIARPDALEHLLDPLTRLNGLPRPSLLAGKVVWTDGKLHPMNIPTFERGEVEQVIAASDHRLIPLRATTFVSLMVHRDVVERHGLPVKGFVIYGDDTDWTSRILRHEPGYLVPMSVVEHRTADPHTASSGTGGRFYYHVRNVLFMLRGPGYGRFEKVALAWMLATSTLQYLRHNAWGRENVTAVVRGLRDGVGALPEGSA